MRATSEAIENAAKDKAMTFREANREALRRLCFPPEKIEAIEAEIKKEVGFLGYFDTPIEPKDEERLIVVMMMGHIRACHMTPEETEDLARRNRQALVKLATGN